MQRRGYIAYNILKPCPLKVYIIYCRLKIHLGPNG
jgi:hypothetical protein